MIILSKSFNLSCHDKYISECELVNKEIELSHFNCLCLSIGRVMKNANTPIAASCLTDFFSPMTEKATLCNLGIKPSCTDSSLIINTDKE